MTIKDAKRNFVIDEAIRLFLEKSITSVTIKDIAKSSGIGEATIYRYFEGRGELVVACALKLQSEVEKMFLGVDASGAGYQKLERFYSAYLDVFENRPELYRFLCEFDSFYVGENASELDEYADNMDKFKEAFCKAYDEGVADGSVKRLEDVNLFYYSTTHAVLSLCKKLALEGGLIRQDRLTDKAAEVKMIIALILDSLKAV